ncbi:MAG: glycosyltransferase family 39 protein [Phycisphaerales bacterium]|nr:glycosyltransferase family 39 protein [Phycisphaerales bacterium]
MPAEPGAAIQPAAQETGHGAARRDDSLRRSLPLILTAVGVFVVTRGLTLTMPLERDEGEYAYIAQRLLLGETPYLDQFNQKTPGIFGAYATLFAVLGESVISVHTALAICTLLTGAMLWRVVGRLTGAGAAAWAALLFALASVDPRLLATAANTEHFGNLGLTLGALACIELRSARSLKSSAMCGLGLASACAFKQVAALPAAWIGLIWLWTVLRSGNESRGGHESRIRRGIHVLAGAVGAAMVAAPIGWFFAAREAWDAFLDGVLWHNLAYINRTAGEEALRALTRALLRQGPILLLPALICTVAVLRRGPGRSGLMIGWLAAATAAAMVSLNFYDHYSIWLLPPLCALAGIGLARAVEDMGLWASWLRRSAAGVMALMVLLVPTLANASFWFAPTAEARAREMYGQSLCVEGEQIAEYLRASGEPSDRILILGSEPQILFHAHRRSATRYVIMYPLFGPYADALQRQEEVLRELAAAPPEWIIEVQLWSSRTPDVNCPRALEQAVAGMITPGRRYELDGVAIPRPGERRYDLKFGEDARALGERARKAATGGVLIYRRVR